MSFNTDDEDFKTQRKLFWFLGTLVGLVTLIVLLYAMVVDSKENQAAAATEVVAEQPATADSQEIAEANGAASAPVAQMASSPVASEQAVAAASDDARVVVEQGIVKFYFATGKTDLAQGADEALQEVVAGVKNGQTALVSGFHDSTGSLEVNERVSKERAQAVQAALLKLGVPADKIELVKPKVLEGSGENAEARRVEVVLK